MTDTQSKHWNEFCDCLKALGLNSALPVDGEYVALYLVYQAETGCELSGMNSFLNEARMRHLQLGFPPPTDTQIVRDTLTGLNRKDMMNLKPVSRAKPLYAEHIEAIRRTAFRPRYSQETRAAAGRRAVLDIALVSTMFDGLLRVGEAAKITWVDISCNRDGSGGLFVSTSEADRKVGVIQWLSPMTMEAVKRIRPEQCNPDDLVFGLNARAMSPRIRATALAAGLGPGFSGFSPRRGMVEQLIRVGIPCVQILRAARWQDHTIWEYFTQQNEFSPGAVEELYTAREKAGDEAADD